MTDMSRRDVVKFAAALAVGAAGGSTASGQEPKKAAAPAPAAPRDDLLALAVASPKSFALDAPVTFRFKTDGRSRDLVFPQTLDQEERRVTVHMPSGTMRVFRADAGVDEFTKKGGLRWEFFGMRGEVTLHAPGAIVMAVREDDTVRCYVMTLDLRC